MSKFIGSRLKEIRSLKNLNVDEFSGIIKINPRTYGGYEREERQAPYSFFTQIEEKFNINLHWLFTGKGSPFLTSESVQEDENVLRIKVKKNQKLLIEYED